MKPLPKPKARWEDHGSESYWVVHYPGTLTRTGWTLRCAYLAWAHRNWTQARILRTVHP